MTFKPEAIYFESTLKRLVRIARRLACADVRDVQQKTHPETVIASAGFVIDLSGKGQNPVIRSFYFFMWPDQILLCIVILCAQNSAPRCAVLNGWQRMAS